MTLSTLFFEQLSATAQIYEPVIKIAYVKGVVGVEC
jgi:hypothetical protein